MVLSSEISQDVATPGSVQGGTTGRRLDLDRRGARDLTETAPDFVLQIDRLGSLGSYRAQANEDDPEAGIDRDQFVDTVSTTLGEIQQTLFNRAATAREDATTTIDRLDEFEAFFADGAPGGLAYCHFVDGPEMDAKLKALKVTARCVPTEGPAEPGQCLFTGQPSPRRAVFARAY